MNRDQPPSTERRIAQIKQTLQQLKCEHPDCAIQLVLIEGGGYVEFCVDCMKILDYHVG